MKTLSFFIAFILFANYSQANVSPDKSLAQQLSQKVQTSLVTPEAFKHQSGSQTVSIWFCVDESGCVTDVSANTKNKEAKADLEKQFRQLNFKGLSPDVYNSINVSFVVY